MIQDWFSHGTSPTDDPWEIPLADDDPWPDRPMRIMRTRPDPTAPPGEHRRPTYANTSTHWWDVSQIYGTTAETEQFVRSRHGRQAAGRPGRAAPAARRPGGATRGWCRGSGSGC